MKKRKILAAWVFTFILFSGFAWKERTHFTGVQLRPGYFYQQGGGLWSGGGFWVPEIDFYRFEKIDMDFLLTGFMGSWLFKDKIGTPVLAPTVEIGPRLVWTGFSSRLGAGSGISLHPLFGFSSPLIFDRSFLEYGALLQFEFPHQMPIVFLGLRGLGVQYIYMDAEIKTQFLGLTLLWRW